MLKHGILGLINYHELTGYEIMGAFRDSLNFFWSAQTSQIYRELQGLEKNGWVSKRVIPGQGKPDKNLFSITAKGREELLRWLADGNWETASRIPFLMKVFFMGEQSRKENIRCFQKMIADCESFLARLDPVPEYIKNYSKYLDEQEKAVYWHMTVDYGRRNMQMYIDWAKDCIRQLEEMEDREV